MFAPLLCHVFGLVPLFHYNCDVGCNNDKKLPSYQNHEWEENYSLVIFHTHKLFLYVNDKEEPHRQSKMNEAYFLFTCTVWLPVFEHIMLA